MLDTQSIRENFRTYPDVLEALEELDSADDLLAHTLAELREYQQIAADLRAALASVVGYGVANWDAVKAFDEKAAR